MEHLVILAIHLVRWLDGLSLKPLRKVVPNLTQLYGNPKATLADRAVDIGPARRYASSIALGLLIALLVFAAGMPLVGAVLGRPNRPLAQAVPLVLGSAVLLGAASVWLMLRVLRGGEMTLTPDGVMISHRGTVVTCPWALFNVIGRPFRPRNDRILLPVLPAAVPFVESEKANVVARGPGVKTRIFSVKSANQVSLRAHYEVDAMELGALLLQLGRLLGGESAGRRAVTEATDAARLVPLPSVSNGRDGWLTVSLTRLLFPPFCCDCGMRTEETQEFQGYAALLRLGSWLNIEGGEHVRVLAPVCFACQRKNRSRYWKTLFKGIALALMLPGVLGIIFS